MSEHTDQRDEIAKRIAVAIALTNIGTARMAEPNFIEVTTPEGVYTVRVCQKRNPANRR